MENFWREFQKADIELPKTILESQRNHFNDNIAQNTLICELSETQEEVSYNPWDDLGIVADEQNKPKRFVCSMYIIAPSLSNYRVLLFKVSYDIAKVYPCTISSIYTGDAEKNCENSEDFKQQLKSVLQSEPIGKLIGMLLAQV